MSIHIQGKRLQINSTNGDSFIGDKIVIGNNNIVVDNEAYPLSEEKEFILNIYGNVEKLEATGCEINAESVHELHVNAGEVNTDYVSGNVTVDTGTVNAHSVDGKVNVNIGSIKVSKVNGDLTF